MPPKKRGPVKRKAVDQGNVVRQTRSQARAFNDLMQPPLSAGPSTSGGTGRQPSQVQRGRGRGRARGRGAVRGSRSISAPRNEFSRQQHRNVQLQDQDILDVRIDAEDDLRIELDGGEQPADRNLVGETHDHQQQQPQPSRHDDHAPVSSQGRPSTSGTSTSMTSASSGNNNSRHFVASAAGSSSGLASSSSGTQQHVQHLSQPRVDRLVQGTAGRLWVAGDSMVSWAGYCNTQFEGCGTTFWMGDSGARLVRVSKMDISENGADAAHLLVLHTPFMQPGYLRDQFGWILSWITHSWDIPENTGWNPHKDKKHMGVMRLRHSISLFGFKMPLTSLPVEAFQNGPGVVHVHMYLPFVGEIVMVLTNTPLEPLMLKVTHAMFAPWYLRVIAKIILCEQALQLERDLMVWNHKTYITKPVLVKEDSYIAKHRRWYSQFYTENSPRYSTRKDGLDW